eukprot:2550647-Pyramimonas_sp.AAC.1
MAAPVSARVAVGGGTVAGGDWSRLDLYSARLGSEPGRALATHGANLSYLVGGIGRREDLWGGWAVNMYSPWRPCFNAFGCSFV